MSKIESVDKLQLSAELQLLLACVTAADDNRAGSDLRDALRRHAAVDWDHFVELCRFHRVYPLVHRALSGPGGADVPPSVIERLALHTRDSRLKLLQLTAELERVVDRFRESDIPCILLKGPVLAAELYGHSSLRPSRDLDLLIREEDVPRADAALRQLRYSGDMPSNRLAREFALKRFQHFVYQNNTRQLCVEIHWRTADAYHREDAFDERWSRGRTVRLSRQSVRYFGDEDLLMHLVSHGAKHGWFRLRWLVDIDRLLRRRPDGQACFEKAREDRMLHLLGQTVLLCRGLLGSPIPAPFESAVDRRAAGLARQAMQFIGSMNDRHESNIFGLEFYRLKRYAFSLHATSAGKARYLLEHFYPSPHEVELLPLPPSLRGLYAPLRPVLWLWRHIRWRRAKPGPAQEAQ